MEGVAVPASMAFLQRQIYDIYAVVFSMKDRDRVYRGQNHQGSLQLSFPTKFYMSLQASLERGFAGKAAVSVQKGLRMSKKAEGMC